MCLGGDTMSASDRLTPKEIKAWCEKKAIITFPKLKKEVNSLALKSMVDLMYKTYKRGYQDALGG